MQEYIKKERYTLSLILIVILIPIAYANSNVLDFFSDDSKLWDLIEGGMQSITGETAVTVSITVGNNAPNISYVSLMGDTYAPASGGIRSIEISFLADDPESSTNLDNTTARVNVSYISSAGSGFLSSSNTSCDSAYIPAGDVINYTCIVQMEYYYDHSTEWTVDAEIKDLNSNAFMNSTWAGTGGNWSYTELVAFNLTALSLSWGSVAPSDTNSTSTTTETVENIGNSLSLDIKPTVIELAGVTNPATIIPAGNFTVFNATTAAKIECDSTNQTAFVTIGVLPIAFINNSQVVSLKNTLRRGQGINRVDQNFCLFDVPAYLTSQTYNTNAGGDWDITAADSGE